MAMNLGSPQSEDPEVLMDINTTPLIDVMLVMIIMLIITIPPQLHAVNLDMPVAVASAKKQDPVVIRLDIDADARLRWNGQLLSDRQALEARLAEVAALQPQPELHIRSHAQAKYEATAAVLASAQRLGLTKLGILGTERFASP
jgi:biopolymer transport protein ExbD